MQNAFLWLFSLIGVNMGVKDLIICTFFIFQVIKIGGGGGELILSCKVNMFIYAIT